MSTWAWSICFTPFLDDDCFVLIPRLRYELKTYAAPKCNFSWNYYTTQDPILSNQRENVSYLDRKKMISPSAQKMAEMIHARMVTCDSGQPSASKW